MRHREVIRIIFSAQMNSNNQQRIRKNIPNRIYSEIKRKQVNQRQQRQSKIKVNICFFSFVSQLDRSIRPSTSGNNIFGSEPAAETSNRSGTIAGQYKQTQMKSSIFGSDEPTNNSRTISDKNRSNIFGPTDADEQNKRQTGGVRQGLRGKTTKKKTKENVNEKFFFRHLDKNLFDIK